MWQALTPPALPTDGDIGQIPAHGAPHYLASPAEDFDQDTPSPGKLTEAMQSQPIATATRGEFITRLQAEFR